MIVKVDIVIHHSPCFDGTTGAWVVKKWCEENKLPVPELYGCKPGMKEYNFPDIKNKSVVIVDICFSREIILELKKDCAELVILDHHKTAEENMKGLEFALFDNSRAGCQIAWDYFFPNKERPHFLNLIADRDLWKWEYSESKAFSAAVFDKYPKVTTEDIEELSSSKICDMVKYGEMILTFQNKQIQHICNSAVKSLIKTPKGEFTVKAVCTRQYRSEVGNELCKAGDCDFAVSFWYCFEKDEWWISFRSITMDISDIAKSFPGGGGHAKAAGFTWYEHINKLLKPIK